MGKIEFDEPPAFVGNTPEDIIAYMEILGDWARALHHTIFGLGTGTVGTLDADNGSLPVSSTTTDVVEGDNLYYTSERTRDDAADFIQDGEALKWTHDDSGDTFTGEVTKATAVTDAAAATVATLTDSTGGSTDDTVVAITAAGGSGATTTQEGEIDDNFAEVTEGINALRVDVADVRTQFNTLMANLRTAKLQAT